MKKLFMLAVAFFVAVNVQAQLKTIPIGNTPVTTETVIEVPNFKKMGPANQSTTPFSPRTISFYQNDKNGLKVMNRATNKLPIFISGQPELQLRNTDTPEGMGYNFLENAKELMSISNPSEEFVTMKVEIDELEMTHIKFQQLHKGIPVYGAEVIFHANDKTQFLNGRYNASLELESVIPTLSQENIKEKTIADLGPIKEIENDKFGLFDFEKYKSNLIIYEGQLAYQVTVYKNIIDRWEYIMDANNGEILDKHPTICKLHNHDSHDSCDHTQTTPDFDERKFSMIPPPDGPTVSNAQDLFGSTRQINTYESGNRFYMIDAARSMFDNANSSIPDEPVGTIWTIDAFDTNPQNSDFNYDHVSSSNSNFSGNQTGVSAQYNGGKAYEYFKNVHSRESINGQGGNVIALVNIGDEDGSSLGNAFWNGIAMFYGNGDNSFKPLARGLDVAGHEMSHGVVQATANLQYQGESGALNESFADVFGVMIDREDWLLGEDVVKTSAFPSGALRSIQDPHNGASEGNFNAGWQPRTYSERFTGSQDNGGVHINSGIPNWAFFKFANASGVGKDRAEQVWYRALDTYLTKSSQFIDARIAVVQAATDLYGATVANAAKIAWDQVEVFNGAGTTTQTDQQANPGTDLIMFTTEDQNNLFIADAEGNLIFNPLTEQNPLSVPSITDDGSEVIFINQDNELYYIRIDWTTTSIIEERVLESNEKWRNAIFSKDGLRLAALRDAQEDKIFVFDFEVSEGNNYTLFNPTFTDGVNTGDVLYADALEFDFSGDFLMYDAFNRIQSNTASNIDYWDIGFIKVFNPSNGNFALGTDEDLLNNPDDTPKIEKLFGQLPEGVSIGNPAFSKNSEYIIAFDFLEGSDFKIKGSNIETGDIRDIFTEGDSPGYPNYSISDDRVIFDASNSSNQAVIGGAILKDNKIESDNVGIQLGFEETGIRWGVWFGNGERALANEDIELPSSSIEIFPNPTAEFINIESTIENAGETKIMITDITGKTLLARTIENLDEKVQLNVSSLATGTYVVTLNSEKGTVSKIFVKK